MLETGTASVTRERGVDGDHKGKPGARQVSVLSLEAWQRACAEIDIDLHWTTRRANLLVEGLEFGSESSGDIIQIGDLRLEIAIETDPCRRMEQAQKGLMKALTPDWRGGVCCRVLTSGNIAVGDNVEVIAQ